MPWIAARAVPSFRTHIVYHEGDGQKVLGSPARQAQARTHNSTLERADEAGRIKSRHLRAGASNHLSLRVHGSKGV